MPKKFHFSGPMGELANDYRDELDDRTAAWKETTRIANAINDILGKNGNDDLYRGFCREFGEEVTDALINLSGDNRAFIFLEGDYPHIVIGTESIPGKNNPGKGDADIVRQYFKIVSLNKLHQLQKRSSQQ